MYTELFETVYPINTPKKEKGVVVTAVDPFALGDQAGIKPGDRILRINEREVRDFLDFQFYTGSEDHVRLEIVAQSGLTRRIDVEVSEGEIWGLDLEHFAPRQCANDCIFCFCNQNPKGSRESLFFKDEDTRLSFLHGNYTTMSSISKLELDRIIEQRLSPQYVSVHATDPEVRRYLLGRKRPDDILGKMRYLADQGIELHAQIVLCPAINDGDILRRTAEELAQLHPVEKRGEGPGIEQAVFGRGGLTSVAVVPVVFTRLHNYHHLLTPVTDEYSRALIKQVRPWQREFRRRFGQAFFFLADEFYMRAGASLPGASHYGDYPQIEDGVGMVRRFIRDAERTLTGLAGRFKPPPGSLDGTIATGKLFQPTLARFVDQINNRFGTRLRTLAIENRFFGEEVTVAGLLAGGDLIATRESIKGNFLIVPEQACLKSGHIFLDDMSLEDLEHKLDIPVAHGGGRLMTMIERAVRLESQNATARLGAAGPWAPLLV